MIIKPVLIVQDLVLLVLPSLYARLVLMVIGLMRQQISVNLVYILVKLVWMKHSAILVVTIKLDMILPQIVHVNPNILQE